MKVVHLIALASVVIPISAVWNTLYAFEAGIAYLHLSNNDLVSVNFTISGEDLNLQNNQKVSKLASPPQDASLFIYDEQLYAFSSSDGAHDATESDTCGNGSLDLTLYDNQTDSWSPVALNFSKIDDTSFYRDATYLTPSLTNSTEMYIYGGVCNSTGAVSSRLLSFDPTTGSFANISTSTKPQPFYGAANLNAPNPQSQLIIGGQSTNNGWLSMFQLATWTFNSGWSFVQVQQGTSSSLTVNSRINALALPVFEPLQNNTQETILGDYRTQSILVLGGDVAPGKSLSFVSKLTTDSNSWSWSNVDTTFNSTEVLGAATLFNTLVVVNGSVPLDGNKYTVNLFDTSSFKPVVSLKQNTKSGAGSSSSTSSSASSGSVPVSTKAILGTILPVSAIIGAIAASVFLMKRKRKNDEEPEEYDYQIGNYYDQSTLQSRKKLGLGLSPTDGYPQYPVAGARSHADPFSNRNGSHHYNLNNDTSSTLEEMSIDSWVRKREEFERAKRDLPNHHDANNFSGSSDTLSSAAGSDVTKVTDPFSGGENGGYVTDLPPPVSATSVAPVVLPSPPPPLHKKLSSSSIMDRSVTKLKKSLSFNTSHSQYGLLKKKSSTLRLKKTVSRSPTLFDDEFAYESRSEGELDDKDKDEEYDDEDDEESNEKLISGENDDDESLDGNMDVQVLVSSKRRSVLRVVNPDLETIHDYGEEDSEDEKRSAEPERGLRQRVPSAPKDE